MKKFLRIQDVLLLVLAGGLDAFLNFKNEPWAEVCKNLYGWIPPRYQKSNLSQSVYHSLKTGYLERDIRDGKAYLRLTPKGNRKIKRYFSLSDRQNKRWDRKWRVVIFDIAEVEKKRRDQLRGKLSELGFGMLQESVWITPYDYLVDLREFLHSWGLQEDTFVFETTSPLGGDDRTLAAKIWSLDQINDDYQALFNDIINLRGRGKISEGELIKLRGRYLEILREDPCLPEELLPTDWFRQKIEKVLKRLK